MIYVQTNSTIPYYNFACEYYLAFEKNLGDDVFMLWQNEPAVIVGQYQNTLEEVNMQYVRERGIHVARRMSGGGTVYHDLGGWQFTFITKSDGEGINFEKFLAPIINALRKLGLDVRATGRNDIALYPEGSDRGYKISGNSQFNKNGITVHHGTLLFDTDIEEMVRATTPKDYKITSKAIKSVRERVTNIREHLKNDMTNEEFRDHMASCLSDVRYDFTEDDIIRLHEIEQDKFATDEWNLGKNPAFEIKKTLHFEGGTLELGFTINDGRIASAGISGDFFGVDANELEAALLGSEFSLESVRTVLTPFGGKLFKIDINELARGITE